MVENFDFWAMKKLSKKTFVLKHRARLSMETHGWLPYVSLL